MNTVDKSFLYIQLYFEAFLIVYPIISVAHPNSIGCLHEAKENFSTKADPEFDSNHFYGCNDSCTSHVSSKFFSYYQLPILLRRL